MPCYHPNLVYRSKEGRNPETGKWPIVWHPRDAYKDLRLQIPCGQCIGCRLERSRQWAIRCIHEAQMHDENSFITLTFSQMPKDGSLHTADFQKFMKRLRKFIAPGKVRYFHCGEYGDQLQRPHHHACLFGYDFPDKVLHSQKNGTRLYTSPILSTLWPFGWAIIGDVTFESAAYVARYCVKKITGKDAPGYYGTRKPPYTTMSRKPGIGSSWLERFKADVYPDDHVVIRDGKICRPPKYYDKYLEETAPAEYKQIRKVRLLTHDDENSTLDRLAVREQVQLLKMEQLKRGYEINETGSL